MTKETTEDSLGPIPPPDPRIGQPLARTVDKRGPIRMVDPEAENLIR